MQPAFAGFVAGRRNPEQRVTMARKPAIKHRPQPGERPDRKYRRQPSPAGQNSNHFNPSLVPFGPTSCGRARVHFPGEFFFCTRGRSAQDCGIRVIQPLNAMIAIVRCDVRPRPSTKIAATVSVNFYLVFAHSFDLIVTQTVSLLLGVGCFRVESGIAKITRQDLQDLKDT